MIPTSPATIPKLNISTPTFSLLNKVIIQALKPPNTPASKVFNKIDVTSGLNSSKLPALKPNQAKNRINTPKTIKLWLLGAKYMVLFFLNLDYLS